MIIKTDQDSIQSYLVDAANIKGDCTAVYIPENEEEIQQIVLECNKTKTTITVSGNGTSLTGARVPKGGIVISTEKLNRIIEINSNEKYAIVEPGVVLSDFKDTVESIGLFYPADPTEQNCFIGSTVATNASGARTFKFGSTRNFVEQLKIILPNGEKFSISRGKVYANKNHFEFYINNTLTSFDIPELDYCVSKNAAGYYCKANMDLIDLFIGSEGTLGIIYEIKFKLLDLPNDFFSTIIFFDDHKQALDFVNTLIKISNKSEYISPSAIEYFDKKSLEFLRNEYPQIPTIVDAALWLEQDTHNNYDDILESYVNLFESNKIDTNNAWFAENKEDRKKFQQFRHAISSKVSEYIAKHNLTKVGTDLAVPSDFFQEFYAKSIEMVKKAKLNYVAYGHFGNSHLHLNMLPKNINELAIAKEVYMQLCIYAIENNGTISAEHGIGKLKHDYLILMFGETVIEQFAKIKKTFDPNLIMGIGNIFDSKYFDYA